MVSICSDVKAGSLLQLKLQELNSSLSYFSSSLLTPVSWLLGHGAVWKTGTCHFGENGAGISYSIGVYLIGSEWLWPRNWRGQVTLYICYGIVHDANRIPYLLTLRQKNSFRLSLYCSCNSIGKWNFSEIWDTFQQEISVNIGSKCELAWVCSCNPFKYTFPGCFSK